MELLRPAAHHLPNYVEAVVKMSKDQTEPFFKMYERELTEIEGDPAKFVELMDDLRAERPPIELPNGTIIPRIPSITRWMWDGEICGCSECDFPESHFS